MGAIYWKLANALAAVVLASRSYTILDRLANAISRDAVAKAVYELGRNLEVIIRNPKDDQAIQLHDEFIEVTLKWGDTPATVKIRGLLPEPRDYEEFLNAAASDIHVARYTAAYASGLVASSLASHGKS
jgi:CRISPR type I-A-associated protein Csa5